VRRLVQRFHFVSLKVFDVNEIITSFRFAGTVPGVAMAFAASSNRRPGKGFIAKLERSSKITNAIKPPEDVARSTARRHRDAAFIAGEWICARVLGRIVWHRICKE